MVIKNAQEWVDINYPKNGVCLGEFDQKNKGIRREEIIELSDFLRIEDKIERVAIVKRWTTILIIVIQVIFIIVVWGEKTILARIPKIPITLPESSLA